MAARSSIEWTDATWNPVRGCSLVSPGCSRCYAMRQAARMGGPGGAYEGLVERSAAGPRWTGRVTFAKDVLGAPLHWRTSRRVFVNSMSDLFHESLGNEEIAAVFGVMAAARRHTFQVLTKRPQRMERWFGWVASQSDGTYMDPAAHVCYRAARRALPAGEAAVVDGATMAWPLPNVWLGVSVEDQARAEERVPPLLRVPATLRFASYEPALGPVDFQALAIGPADARHVDVLRGGHRSPSWGLVGHGHMWPLDWVIVGGESGPKARPFDEDWAVLTVRACKAAGVPCFVKQLGSAAYALSGDSLCDDGTPPIGGWLRLRDSKGGDPSEWREDLRVREIPGRSAR